MNVNCGIVHVYMSYDNPHPSAALYSDKVTATDGHPAILSLEKTVDGRPLYMSFVGTHLPAESAGLKNCSDAHFNTTIISVNESGRGTFQQIVLHYVNFHTLLNVIYFEIFGFEIIID